jgi:manganese transport protein
VILSLQLPFAVVPLVHFTSDRLKMGSFVSPAWVKVLAWITAASIIVLNGKLVLDQIMELMEGSAPLIVSLSIIGMASGISLFLVYIFLLPLIRGERGWKEGKLTGASAVLEGIATYRSKHIAAALGRDESDAAIVSHAMSLAKAERALLTLIHVADSAPSQVYSGEVYDEHTRDDEQYLMAIASELSSSGVAVEIALPQGDPSTELIRFAESHGVDLLVMGSHGHRLLGNLLWGETVNPVRHQVAIPVLVVR